MKRNIRRILAFLLIGCMVLVFASCGNSASPSSTAGEPPASGEEKVSDKDTLIVAANREPVSLDPAAVNVTYAWLIESHLYDCLLKMDKDLNIVSDLAESWKQLDDLTWKFNLRKGVKFHNGEELTSKDVLFSFKRLYNEPAAKIAVQFIDENGF